MLGGHARTKTDSILRHSRVIHRRNPKTAPAKFMPQLIHATAIADDDGHDISCGCSGVEAQALKLRVKVMGIFPELHAQFWLTGAELERLQGRRDPPWRQRAGVNIRMRVETQILQRLLRARDKATQRPERFGERSIHEWNAIFHATVLSRPSAAFAAAKHGVRFINENTGTVRFRNGK